MRTDVNGKIRERKILSAAFGFLLMRALPMGAVAAEWNLSASLGVTIGELLAVIIFAVGSGVVLAARQIDNSRIYHLSRTTAAIVYVLVSGIFEQTAAAVSTGFKNTLIIVIDCILTVTALFAGLSLKKILFDFGITLVISLILSATIEGLAGSNMILPLAAALAAGIAITYASLEQKLNSELILAGMVTAMLIDLLK